MKNNNNNKVDLKTLRSQHTYWTKSMKFSMLKGSHTPATAHVSQVIPVRSITQTHRLRPKPIFFTRFNTLEIFYVRIILMVLRCVGAVAYVVWWHTIFFLHIFCSGHPGLASWHTLCRWCWPGGGHWSPHFRTFLWRLTGDWRGWAWPSSGDQRKVRLISGFIVAIKVI